MNSKDTSSNKKKLQLTRTVEGASVQQKLAGRSKSIKVEVRRTRTFSQDKSGSVVEEKASSKNGQSASEEALFKEDKDTGSLSTAEKEARLKALSSAKARKVEEPEEKEESPARKSEKKAETQKAKKNEEKEEDIAKKLPTPEEIAEQEALSEQDPNKKQKGSGKLILPEFKKSGDGEAKSVSGKPRKDERRREQKLTLSQMLSQDQEGHRGRSMAAERRAREKAKKAAALARGEIKEPEKFIREVVIPETISVQELANRMAVRSVDVIKELMKLGIMANANQSLDADTAEIVVTEFGHKFKRVTEDELEQSIFGESEDLDDKNLQPRPPVVTIMGHVDHGKTSLLDALRETDIAAGESGGITQHIGAYQTTLADGSRITFLDTPGHEAFTEMRMRGAKATDIVVLVVAADDGIMPQTVEAISHAKAAEVPIIVAINKIDKPDANSKKVKDALLSHELIPEDLGGDIQVVEVSAKNKIGLDKLEEAILIQAEMLELTANPDRIAAGVVVEAEVDAGRGTVATLLVQKGTLRLGDIVVAGRGYGRVRALINDKGKNLESAEPSLPVEVLGLDEVPESGEQFAVVETEKLAREITEFRLKKKRDLKAVATKDVSLEDMFLKAGSGGKKLLPIIVKGDVHGSVEAIINNLEKIASNEVGVKVLYSAAGGITESDVRLAQTANAIIIGFNVRANSQAKELASSESVDMRYYSIIYNVVDDIKAALSGMMKPLIREEYLGTAEILQVFKVSKLGKVAGCMVNDGIIRRGAGVRLIRDDVVIHEGRLKTLKRFKDEVNEVKNGTECGMAFENYEDLKEGDKIEAFEIIEEKQKLE